MSDTLKEVRLLRRTEDHMRYYVAAACQRLVKGGGLRPDAAMWVYVVSDTQKAETPLWVIAKGQLPDVMVTEMNLTLHYSRPIVYLRAVE